jgi:hypothetical protein
MANSNGWGDGSANNAIGWGQGANNAIGWGDIHADSWAGLTDIVGVTTDPDAQAFITAASITDPTQQAAINTLVVDLKGYSIWTKFSALYPFVTDKTVEADIKSQMKFNLKDPRDLDAAFRLTWNGGGSWTANGYQPNGINGFADTKLNANTTLNLNNSSISYYSRENKPTSCLMGAGFNQSSIILIPKFSSGDNTDYSNVYSTASNQTAQSNTQGLFLANRIISTSFKCFQNGVVYLNKNISSVSKPNSNVFIGARSETIFGQQYTSNQCAFASIGDGLTDTEALNFYTAVQAFQTALNRNV